MIQSVRIANGLLNNEIFEKHQLTAYDAGPARGSRVKALPGNHPAQKPYCGGSKGKDSDRPGLADWRNKPQSRPIVKICVNPHYNF
jgi:hypothetical protein